MSESVAQLDNGTDEIVAYHKVKRKFFILADMLSEDPELRRELSRGAKLISEESMD